MAKKARRSAPRSSPRPTARAHKKKVAKKGATRSPKARAATTVRDQVLAFVKFTHGYLSGKAGSIPDEHACAQSGCAQNHRLWTYGHLAVSDEWFAGLLDGKPRTTPESWDPLFNMGSKPTNDPHTYPPLADVKTAFERAHQRVILAIQSHNDASLMEMVKEDTGGFVTTRLDVAMKCAWHHGWHLGQITDLRRGLGLMTK